MPVIYLRENCANCAVVYVGSNNNINCQLLIGPSKDRAGKCSFDDLNITDNIVIFMYLHTS